MPAVTEKGCGWRPGSDTQGREKKKMPLSASFACVLLEAMGNLHLAHPDIRGLFTSCVMVFTEGCVPHLICHTFTSVITLLAY